MVKYGKEVMGPSGVPGAYDEMAVDCPFVFYHNNQYYMMHVGFDGKGYQTGPGSKPGSASLEERGDYIQKRGTGRLG